MAQFAILAGSTLGVLAGLWIAALVVKILAGLFTPKRRREPSPWLRRIGNWIEIPVNGVRWMLPTVYRKVDFAPWLTLLLLVLFKTFVARALVYWGMLHRPMV